MKRAVVILLVLVSQIALGQTGSISGKVVEEYSNEPIPYASVFIDGTSKGASTNEEGVYKIENLEPGVYSVGASFLGYDTRIINAIQVLPGRVTSLDIKLNEQETKLDEVVIKKKVFQRVEEAPLSLRNISAAEIQRSPGGNRDISKVVTSLPGVSTTSSFRNDILIRGGAPNENRFYLDDIEIPNINHFATQGSSGGPVGMLNVNFIQEVDFFAGAFPANRGNTLSSVMNFRQKEGNSEKWIRNFTVGSSDYGLTLDGPVSNNSNLIFSVRRSYLQALFKALKLPFLPIYNDAQLKYTIKPDNKNRISIIGLGAIDDFELNAGINDNESDPDVLRRNNYILERLPVNTQWNYTLGASWKHFREKNFQTLVVSRNHLNNRSEKYLDNIENPANLILDYRSQEIENKIRFEESWRLGTQKINAGVGLQHVTYTNNTFNRRSVGPVVTTFNFDSRLTLLKYAVFGQYSKDLFDRRLTLSAGIRTDWNSYSADMANPIDQLSPRISASWLAIPDWSIRLNANAGRYYQLPPYTVMGFENNFGELVNKSNGLKYIGADHLVAGIEWAGSEYTRITLEGFYKNYFQYPFLVNDSISLANLGSDFGIIGNEEVSSIGSGRSYGMEFMIQRKIHNGFFGILAYTMVRSEYKDKNDQFVASAWDNRHIISLTAGKRLKRNWEIGAKLRYNGGLPFTPWDYTQSALIPVWDVNRQPLRDYNALNTQRGVAYHGMDIRVDKNWYFEKWSLNLYLDIQNVYNASFVEQPDVDAVRDPNGFPVVDPNDPSRYLLEEIPNENGLLLPAIGLMLEF